MEKPEKNKLTGIYYYSWYDPETRNRKRKSLRTKNLPEALKRLAKINQHVDDARIVKAAAEITGINPIRRFKVINIYSLLDRFAVDTAYKRKPDGQATVDRRIGYIKSILDDRPANKITSEVLRDYIKRRRNAGIRLPAVKPQTINRELEVLDAAFNWMVRQQDAGLDRKPYQGMPYLDPDTYEATIPTQEQIGQIRQFLLERDNWSNLNTMEMILGTCMRTGGVSSIQGWKKIGLQGWIDPETWSVRFLQTKKKRGTDVWRTLSLTGRTLEYFQGQYQRDSLAIAFNPTNYALYWACEALNLPQFNWTAFRHYFVLDSKLSGLSEWDVLAITGHHDSNLIKRVYGRLDDRAASDALRKKSALARQSG